MENLRKPYELLSCLHLSFAGLAILFRSNEATSIPFIRIEYLANTILGIRNTDFVRGYFVIWIPTVVIALLCYALLNTIQGTRFAEQGLPPLLGSAAIVIPLVFWTTVGHPWGYDWLDLNGQIETAFALAALVLFMRARWTPPLLATIAVLAGHYIFWLMRPFTDPIRPGYDGPADQSWAFALLLHGALTSRSERSIAKAVSRSRLVS